MKKLLILTGDLATGKTTFMNRLSNRYGVHAFCKDSLKEVLGDTVGFHTREENKRLSVAAVELMSAVFAEFAHRGDDLILEANYRSAELEKLHGIAAENGYSVLTLIFRADCEILFKRFINRIENENRHPVHQSAGLTDLEKFRDYIESLRAEAVPGDVLSVNADDFSYNNDSVLLASIDGFMARLPQED